MGTRLVRARHLGCLAALAAFSLTASLSTTADAARRCTLAMTPPLPVKMENLRPVISAGINGVDARFIVDTGSFFDFLSPAAAAQFKLPLRYAPPDFYVNGVGGSVVPMLATAKTFTVAGITTQYAEFLVGDNDFRGDVVGLLGQNLFRIADVDFDFADGVLRFVEPKHCRDQPLAYWAATQPVGEVDLHWTSPQRPQLIGKAAVNGHDIDVLFDTGSGRSILSLDAAKRAGITPESPGVVPAGVTSGIGKNEVKVWIAPIDKFEIGGEAIEHTHVLIGDIDLPGTGADMLLGSDFFLAHHVYVANSQNKLYFTYNGGPVFDLNTRRPAQTASARNIPTGRSPPPTAGTGHGPQTSASSQSAAAPASGGVAGNSSQQATPASLLDTPTDAAGFLRQGMADTSRGDFPEAIADLSRACKLDPRSADCRYQRGLAYWHSGQTDAALADLSAAIQLRPNDFEAYLARAQLELRRQPAGAQSDLDAVDRFAPEQSDLRLMLARLYEVAGEYAGAVHQYDLWIEYHAEDVRLPFALSNRCGSEAAANVDVDRALEDCNTALHLMPKAAPVQATAVALSNRGLVYLRDGRLDSALADFDAALERLPKFALARYARGVVELRKGLEAQGRADLAEAELHRPGLVKRMASIGLGP
jgi:tetratricopeptide (TPR) repeat protein